MFLSGLKEKIKIKMWLRGFDPGAFTLVDKYEDFLELQELTLENKDYK